MRIGIALERLARPELIKFYKSYIKGKSILSLKHKAKELYENLCPAYTLLSEETNAAVGRLFNFYVKTGLNPTTRQEAKKIVESLSSKYMPTKGINSPVKRHCLPKGRKGVLVCGK